MDSPYSAMTVELLIDIKKLLTKILDCHLKEAQLEAERQARWAKIEIQPGTTKQ